MEVKEIRQVSNDAVSLWESRKDKAQAPDAVWPQLRFYQPGEPDKSEVCVLCREFPVKIKLVADDDQDERAISSPANTARATRVHPDCNFVIRSLSCTRATRSFDPSVKAKPSSFILPDFQINIDCLEFSTDGIARRTNFLTCSQIGINIAANSETCQAIPYIHFCLFNQPCGLERFLRSNRNQPKTT